MKDTYFIGKVLRNNDQLYITRHKDEFGKKIRRLYGKSELRLRDLLVLKFMFYKLS